MTGFAKLLLAVITLSCVATLSAQRPVFTSSTDVVFVAVTVTSGNKPVPGLNAADFSLTDNGVPQRLELVDVERMPLDVSVVLGAGNRIDGDQVTQSLTEFNQLSKQLNAADRLRPISVGEWIVQQNPMISAQPSHETRTSPTRGNSFNDALFYALAWPADPQRRHLVIAFMNGFDTWSALDASRLTSLARRSDAVIHVVAFEPGGLPSLFRTDGWEREREAVAKAATTTGGTISKLSKSGETMTRILAEFRSSYLLRFSPESVQQTGWHTLNVRVPGRRGLTIRARAGYNDK